MDDNAWLEGQEGMAPLWLQNLLQQHEQQRQQMEQQQAHLNAEVQRLRSEIQNTSLLSTRNPTPASLTPPPTNDTPRRPRPRLPDVEKFDGSDKSLYPQFESQLEAKLQVDAASIGETTEQIWYSFSRLSGKAAARIHPWIATYKGTPGFTVENFVAQLRTAFQDAALQEKAIDRLNTIRQADRPFDDFLSEFDRLLLEAGAHAWDAKVKKGYLKSALNRSMKEKLVVIEEKETYEGYCQQIKAIADRLADFRSRRYRPGFNQGAGNTNDNGAAMDWEPTVNNARSQRAKWADNATRKRRRDEGSCIRCGGPNHYIANCPYLPAVPPHAQGRENANRGGTPNGYRPPAMNVVQNDNPAKPKVEPEGEAKVPPPQYDSGKE